MLSKYDPHEQWFVGATTESQVSLEHARLVVSAPFVLTPPGNRNKPPSLCASPLAAQA